ncbi:MAG: imelysin family protein [Tabrizicola flagellatus]|uniref:imelysin family protein n=1 Tax=Tabrizicola flagellatus TaxID=2593021 RepID=UPI003919A03F
MRRSVLILAIVLGAGRTAADVPRALDGVLLPHLAAFAGAARALADSAAADCSRTSVLPAYHAARDAWAAVGDIRLGPTEAAAPTIAFTGDDRMIGLRALRAASAAAVADAGRLPAPARGLAGLDLMLGEAELDYGPGSPGCALVRALATDLAAQAANLHAGWDAYAPLLRNPGAAGNDAYLDSRESVRALSTQILAAVEVAARTRLGRPLGTFDRPRPARAEAWRTVRPLSDAMAALRGAAALAMALADAPLPKTQAALRRVEAAAAAIADPSFQDIGDPQARLRLEILQQRVEALRAALLEELGRTLGVAPGFNAMDGD